MEEQKTDGLGTMPVEPVEQAILNELTAIELQNVDPVFSSKYIEDKARTTDAADRMRLDIQMLDRVAELQREGKMSAPDLLRPEAAKMVNLNADGMRKAFSNFSQGLRKPAAK